MIGPWGTLERGVTLSNPSQHDALTRPSRERRFSDDGADRRGECRSTVTRMTRVRTGLLVGVIGVLLLAGASCGIPRLNNPDRGNVKLHLLEHDPVFGQLPPQSQLLKPLVVHPARYDNQGPLGSSGWEGPVVTEDFKSQLALPDVAAFIDTRAHSSGWALTGTQSGQPGQWQKTLTGGVVASMSLYSGSSGAGSFELTASA